MLKKRFTFLLYKIQNYPLKIKIALITAFSIALVSLATLICSFILVNSYNVQLYQALAGSLNYSAEDISSKLANIESMTNAIISNQYIRKSLISIADEPESWVLKQNADNTISAALVDYYQNYKSNDISYISLYNPKFVSSSFTLTPMIFRKTLLQILSHMPLKIPDMPAGSQITATVMDCFSDVIPEEYRI